MRITKLPKYRVTRKPRYRIVKRRRRIRIVPCIQVEMRLQKGVWEARWCLPPPEGCRECRGSGARPLEALAALYEASQGKGAELPPQDRARSCYVAAGGK